MKIQRIKDIITGSVITAIVIGTGATAFAKATNMNIPVSFNNIKIIVDGKAIETDKEPFIYDGTTYLPVRAVGEAIGKEVSWNGSTNTVILGKTGTENAAGESTKSYSRSNPAPIGVTQTVNIDNYSTKYTAEIEIINAERGSSAWEKIIDANMFNDPAPDGKEYILAYVSATVKSVENDKSVSFSGYDFTPFSGKDSEYKRASVVEPEPEFSGQVYKDGKTEGYVAFLVDTNDSSPKVSFGTNYDGTGGAWFKLTK